MPRSSVFGRLVLLIGIMLAFGAPGPAFACPTELAVSSEPSQPSRDCCDHHGSNSCARSCAWMCQALLPANPEDGRDVAISSVLHGQTLPVLETSRSGPEPPPPRGS